MPVNFIPSGFHFPRGCCRLNNRFSHGQTLLCTGKQPFCVNYFTTVKLPRGNFHVYVKKDKNNISWGTVLEVSSVGWLEPKADQPITKHLNVPNSRNHVLCTCCDHFAANNKILCVVFKSNYSKELGIFLYINVTKFLPANFVDPYL